MKRSSMLTGVAVAALAAPMMTLPAHAAYHCGGSYTVQPGDTLAGIAALCNSSVGDLTRANVQIVDPSRIEVGWRLTIPEAGYQANDEIGLSSQTELTPYTDQSGYVSTYDVPPYSGATNAQDYRVQPGDTFAGIATQLGLSLANLMAANSGVSPYNLRAGEVIRVPNGYYQRDRYDHDRYDRGRYVRNDWRDHDRYDHDHDRSRDNDRGHNHSWRDRDHDHDRYENDRYGENHDRDRWDRHDRSDNDRARSDRRDQDHDRYSRNDRDDRADDSERDHRDRKDRNVTETWHGLNADSSNWASNYRNGGNLPLGWRADHSK